MFGGKRDKKAGVITPYGLYNYGNRLQAYAVCLLAEKNGVRAEEVLTPSVNQQSGMKALAKQTVYSVAGRGKKARRYKAFKQFDDQIPKRRYRSDEKAALAGYDYALIGSDQIWNPNHIDPTPAVFGSFVASEQRICISPSFGVSSLPSSLERRYAEGIEEIGTLSVREDAGAEIIRKLTGREALVLLDPTFGLTKKEWENVSSKELIPERPYVFSYFLGAGCCEQKNAVADFAKRLGFELVDVMDPYSDWYISGPQDFIGLVRDASFVCTNSYHASVFSMLFSKPFRIFGRYDGPSMSSRISTLASRFGIDRRISDMPLSESDLNACVDLDRAIDVQRKAINQYLASAFASK